MQQLQEAGRFLARAVSGKLGETSDKHTPFIALQFALVHDDGTPNGYEVESRLYFSDKTIERSMDQLRLCGWATDDLRDMTGLGSTIVELTTGWEEYNGRNNLRVKWIQAPGGGGLPDDAAQAFARKMFNAAKASRARHKPAANAAPLPPLVIPSGPAAPSTEAPREPGIDDDDVPF